MILDFQQGIVRHSAIGSVQTFLQIQSNVVSLSVTNGPTIVSFAHRTENYLLIEETAITNAWSNIPSIGDVWIYWDIHQTTAIRTFGLTTLPPITSHTRPLTPTEDQHWFDLNAKQMWVYSASVWKPVIRVFAAKISSGSNITPLGMIGTTLGFSGSQVGLNVVGVPTGTILIDDHGLPIKRTNGTFITTEDKIFSNGSIINPIRLESNIVRLNAVEHIPKFSVIKLITFVDAGLAAPHDIIDVILAVVTEDIAVNTSGLAIVQGVVTNPDWIFDTPGVLLYVGLTGQLTSTPPFPANGYPPVAKVLSQNSILFDQSQFGGVGSGGSGTVSPATTTSLGVSLLSLPATNPLAPIVVGDNDPRLNNRQLVALTDVQLTSPANGQVLQYNGFKWINSNITLDVLPAQSGNTGKFLTTNGTAASWQGINLVPDIAAHAGQFLFTDGSNIVWSTIDLLPAQSGNIGKFLTTNGTTASWIPVDLLPNQATHAGQFLTTNGTTTSWSTISTLPAQATHTGKFLTTNGTTASWSPLNAFPTQTGNAGKVLTTNGTAVNWSVMDSLPAQLGNTGKFLTTNGTAASWSVLNVFPTQTGNTGKFLSTDGTSVFWNTVDANSVLAGGDIGQLQYNNNGFLDGLPGAVSDGTNIIISGGSNLFLPTLGSNGFVKLGAGGQLVRDPTNYLTQNQTITLSGDITGSGITGISVSLNTIPIAKGGTGQTTANAALNALLPSQSGNAGNTLITDGANVRWAVSGENGAGAAAGGPGTIQYNTNDLLTGDSAFTWDSANVKLKIGTKIELFGTAGVLSFPAGSAIITSGTGNLDLVGGRLNISNSGGISFGGSGTGISGQFLISNGNAAPNWQTRYTLPTMSGQSGKYLTNDGINPSWISIAAGSVPAGGAQGAIQYNNGTAFAGSLNIFTDGTDLFSPAAFIIRMGTLASSFEAFRINTSGGVSFGGSFGSSGYSLVSTGGGVPTWQRIIGLPTQSYPTTSGKYLISDGTNASWASFNTSFTITPDITTQRGMLTINNGSATAEGARIVMAYNGVTDLLSNSYRNSWTIDIDSNDQFRIYRINNSGSTIIPVSIAETTGTVVLNYGLLAQGSITFPTLGDAGVLRLSTGGVVSADTTINGFYPTQTGNVGKFLVTDGTNVSWADITSTSVGAGGAFGQLQYNASGFIGGIAGITSDGTNLVINSGSSLFLPALGTSGFLKLSTSGLVIRDANTYLTGNQSITVTGDATGSGTTSINLTLGTVPIIKGGTGQTTANNAVNALLPSQIGHSGKVLTTDGSNTSWVTSGSGSGGTPGGSNTQLQYNNSGVFGGLSGITTDGTDLTISTSLFLSTLGTSGFLKLSTGGRVIQDTSTYLTGNQAITLSGDVSGSGTTSISVTIATVPISKGGTGQVTASAAINALVPTQTSNAGLFLKTDGTVVSWADPNTSVVAAGSTTQIQYNNGGSFAGAAGLTTDGNNLIFSGNGRKLTANMTAAAPDRFTIQTSVVNGSTGLWITPNGSSQVSAFSVNNNSSLTGSYSYLNNQITSTEAFVESGAIGGATNFPLSFKTSVAIQMQVLAGIAAINYLTIQGSLASNAVTIGSGGSDTRVDINIVPKGTGNLILGSGALATTATDGFLYIPSMPGAPSGVPTTYTGRSALVVDTTNNVLYGYDSVDSTWLNLTGTVGGVGIAGGSPTQIQYNSGGVLVGAAGLTTDGNNLIFSGTGRRITGDFSNSTTSNRVSFQTSTVNGYTVVQSIPNGSSGIATFTALNSSDPNNAGFFQWQADTASHYLLSSHTGTGTDLPISFNTPTTQLQIATSTNAVNYWMLQGSATGSNITLGAAGADANISMAVSAKGNGAVQINTDVTIIKPLSSNNCGIELGSTTVGGLAYFDFHSSGTTADFDCRLISSGGTSTLGNGILKMECDTFNLHANNGLKITQPVVGNVGQLILNNGTSSTLGARIVMAYKTISTLSSPGNSSWNLNIDSANGFNISKTTSGGATSTPFSITETSGLVSIGSGLLVTGSLTFPTLGSSGYLQLTAGGVIVAGAVGSSFPTQTGNTNKYLQTDGTNALWGAFTGNLDSITDVILTSPTNGQILQYNGTDWVNYSLTGLPASPGGSSGQIQYNSAGTTAGAAGVTTDGTNLTVAGVITESGGDFSVSGDAVSKQYVLRNSTTNATPTELFLNGSSTRMTMTLDSTWKFDVHVVGRRTDVDGESAGFHIEGCIDINTSTSSCSLVGSVLKTIVAKDNANWDVDVFANSTVGALNIVVTGEAAKNIKWVAFVRTIEVVG